MRASHEGRVRLSGNAATVIADLEVNPTPESVAEFAEFATTSPDHLGAIILVSAGLVGLEAVEAERRAALVRLTRATAVPLHKATVIDIHPPASSGRGFSMRQLPGAFAALVIVAMAVTWFACSHKRLLEEERIERPTEIAQTEKIYQHFGIYDVRKGTRLRLEFGTRVDVRSFNSGSGLEVRLLEGKAHISQDHDPTRPLRVLIGRTVVEDLGTDFEVTKKTNSTEITVLEGTVRITQCGPEAAAAGRKSLSAPAGGDAARAVVLWRDQTVTVDERQCEGPLAPKIPKTEELASSDGVTIRDAIEMFNRNNRDFLIVADPKVANLKVGGIIKASEIAGFLLFLRRELKVIALPVEAPPGCSVLYLKPET